MTKNPKKITSTPSIPSGPEPDYEEDEREVEETARHCGSITCRDWHSIHGDLGRIEKDMERLQTTCRTFVDMAWRELHSSGLDKENPCATLSDVLRQDMSFKQLRRAIWRLTPDRLSYIHSHLEDVQKEIPCQVDFFKTPDETAKDKDAKDVI